MPPSLERRITLLQATALNMSNMIGIGPFITIPLLMTGLGGPQALARMGCGARHRRRPTGWSGASSARRCPGSGGTYQYLREGFGPATCGRLMAFLFIWQFILSGPLEIASGYIGFAQLRALRLAGACAAAAAWPSRCVVGRVEHRAPVPPDRFDRRAHGDALDRHPPDDARASSSAARSTSTRRCAFDLPPDAFRFSLGFLLGLGASARIGIYDYLGYYDVCYIGDEVQAPGPRHSARDPDQRGRRGADLRRRSTCRSSASSPGASSCRHRRTPQADFIVSMFMERLYGTRVATVVHGPGALDGVRRRCSRCSSATRASRMPRRSTARSSACSAACIPTKHFPHVSLLVIGAISIVCSTFSLGTVIDALLTTRILVQFIGQVVAVMLLRRVQPDMPRPFRMWLYPLPALVALRRLGLRARDLGSDGDPVRPRHAGARRRACSSPGRGNGTLAFNRYR